MEKNVISSCTDSEEMEMQRLQKKASIIKYSCLNGLRALKSKFTLISKKDVPSITASEFEHVFSRIFGEEVDTFTRTFSQNIDTLETQLTKETLYESNCQTAFRVLKTPFEKIFTFVLIKSSSLDGTYSQKGFKAYTGMEPQAFKERILANFDFIQKSRNECNDKSTSRDDTDIRPSYDIKPMAEVAYTAEYNVFAVETQHSKQLENTNDTSLMEKVDSNTTPDSSDMCNNELKDDQNADDHEDERVVLADLIANLKCDIDEKKDSKAIKERKYNTYS
ncbi:hypothetical protein Tco_1252845 [Tanacetum coccineum]